MESPHVNRFHTIFDIALQYIVNASLLSSSIFCRLDKTLVTSKHYINSNQTLFHLDVLVSYQRPKPSSGSCHSRKMKKSNKIKFSSITTVIFNVLTWLQKLKKLGRYNIFVALRDPKFSFC